MPRFRGRLSVAGHGPLPGLIHVFNGVLFSILRVYDYLMHLVATPFVRLLVPTQAILVDLNLNVVDSEGTRSVLAPDPEHGSQD